MRFKNVEILNRKASRDGKVENNRRKLFLDVGAFWMWILFSLKRLRKQEVINQDYQEGGKTKYQEGQLSLQQEANKGRSSDLDQLDLPPKDRFALRDRKRIIKEDVRVR